MVDKSRWRSAFSGLALVVGAIVLPLSAKPALAEQKVEVLKAPDQATTPVDRRMLLSVYIGRLTSWPNGEPIRVFVLSDDSPLHVEFCRQLLGTYPYVLRNAWDKLVYTGTGFAPTTVTNEAEMRKRVSETPGAIGYIVTNNTGSMLENLHAGREMATRGAAQ